ncbi:MAG TPA: HAD-IB family phosphatase [Candidatus Nanoarchaeia archaeon]|nr:HAD-IB family phosphatase [Candidatus Nanoarchaeia archaeon]
MKNKERTAVKAKAKKSATPQYKLIVFDIDGTLITDKVFIWHAVHEFMQSDRSALLKAHEEFSSRKISYERYLSCDAGLLMANNATKKMILKSIEGMQLAVGARETLEELKRRGYKLAVISGSLSLALQKVLPDYDEFFDDVFINHFFFDDDGRLMGWKATPYDFEHKATGLKHLAKKYGISTRQCVFIGDNHNDLHIAEEAGLSIAFNCKSDTLAQVADIVTKTDDLREILHYIP